VAIRAPTFRLNILIGSAKSYETRLNSYQRGYTDKHWRGDKRQHGYGGLRGLIYRRDKGICQICGRICVPKDAGNGTDRALWPHVDHIVPKSKGGTDDPSNLQLLCGSCNSIKKDKEDTARKSLPDKGIRGPK